MRGQKRTYSNHQDKTEVRRKNLHQGIDRNRIDQHMNRKRHTGRETRRTSATHQNTWTYHVVVYQRIDWFPVKSLPCCWGPTCWARLEASMKSYRYLASTKLVICTALVIPFYIEGVESYRCFVTSRSSSMTSMTSSPWNFALLECITHRNRY